MVLDTEVKTYEEKLSELLTHEGKFVVIHGNDVVGIFDSYDDALKTAYNQFHAEPFLLKQIKAVEQIQFVR